MRIVLRMAVIALVLGTAASISAAGRITPTLLASTALCWSFVPVVQLFTGLLLVRGSRMPLEEALDRYFATHWVWSLWLLSSAMVVLALPSPAGWVVPVLATAVLPMALTARELMILGRRDFGFSASTARRRAALHQAATIAIGLAYGEYAGGLLRRLADTIRP